MKLHQANDTLLRRVLVANALSSASSGLLCLLFPQAAATLLFENTFSVLGISPSGLLLALGIGLLIFAIFVLVTAREETLAMGRARLVCLADLLWVVDSVALLLVFPDTFSPIGFEIVSVVALCVLLFALGQLAGIALVYQGRSDVRVSARKDGWMTVTASIETTASAARVWQVMRDQKCYADVADNLSKAEIIAGQGEGMVRQCTDTAGRSWRETCSRWEEGQGFAFRVHTEAADYPYPIARMTGEWTLSPTKRGTRISMTFGIQAKSGFTGRLIFNVMAASFPRICDRLLRNWTRVMEDRENSAVCRPPLAAPAANPGA
ncbi:MAG: SRPBCC family protein [Alphaproteobacteria bacterium]|nr:SRPBCC family protein [Alphaproteobacteria bacterium]